MVRFSAVVAAVALGLGGCSERLLEPAPPEPPDEPVMVAATPAAIMAAEVARAGDDNPVPHATGKGRWRDANVYLDGVHVGTLWFGELPRELEPVWVESVESLDFKPGDTGPRERTIRERRYRYADYLEALDVDLSKIAMVHIHSGGGFVSEVPGKLFRKWKRDLHFRFAGETFGKAIPYFPANMPRNADFDRIAAVAVYIDKTPPTINDHAIPELDGKRVEGIAYAGIPTRGGVRVYKNNRLVATIKRRKLEEVGVPVVEELDGHPSFDLFGALSALGVDTTDVACGEVIYDERRIKILDREYLAAASVKALAGRGGTVRFRDGVDFNALALYTTKLTSPAPRVVEPD